MKNINLSCSNRAMIINGFSNTNIIIKNFPYINITNVSVESIQTDSENFFAIFLTSEQNYYLLFFNNISFDQIAWSNNNNLNPYIYYMHFL